MRLRINATLTNTSAAPVNKAHIEVRLSPAATSRQLVLAHPLSTDPSGFQITYDDYWGTRVAELEISEQHEKFTVSMLSDVNVTFRPAQPPAADFSVVEGTRIADAFFEYLRGDLLTTPSQDMLAAAAGARPTAANPRELVDRLAEQAPVGMVGDDLTHVVIGALRSQGVPARFVSGYRAPVEDFEPGQASPGVITSWVDYWDGRWKSWDPELRLDIGDRHVTIGWGRDRSDCPPLRGVYAGAADATCVTDVTITRLS